MSNETMTSSAPQNRGHSVEHAVHSIRDLIVARELSPGEQLRQVELSKRIGLSRGPTREALQALSNEGLVTYSRNRGYTVARFSLTELRQLYRLRELVETELLLTVQEPTEAVLQNLHDINTAIRNEKFSRQRAMELNRDFHFEIFQLSPHKLIFQEVVRLWTMSSAYMALTLAPWPTANTQMGDEHEEIIESVRTLQVENLVELSNAHRNRSLQRLEAFLG